MRGSLARATKLTVALVFVCVVLAGGGCSRTKYRLRADQEAYSAISERNCDARWQATDPRIELDPRSRYFDPHDPDRPPMPPDDPTAHQYMRRVAGRRGWKHWYENGCRADLENPTWRENLGQYVPINADGAVVLNTDTAMQLAYMHSPLHQRQLETLYLSALDVTAERFRLDTQFFGGYDVVYDHRGSLVPAGLAFDPTAGKFVVTPPFEAASLETNRVTLGRPNAGNPALQMQRRFATAGQLLVGFANSFVFEFTGGNANLAASLANFSFIQPLLRGAGKDVALEDLTLDERRLLSNLRAYAQFRQGFYTEIAIGERGVTGPLRGGFGTGLQSFGGQGGVGGYLGLLQQLQEYRNSDDNLRLQLRTRDRLEALYDSDFISLVQVDQFRQSVEAKRSELLLRQNNLELALDRYKTTTLGLPPDLPIELDEELIRPFQLIPPNSAALLNAIFDLQRRLATLPDQPDMETLTLVLQQGESLTEAADELFTTAQLDLERLSSVAAVRERTMTPEEQARFRQDRDQLYRKLRDLRTGNKGFNAAARRLGTLKDGLSLQTRAETLDGLRGWAQPFLQVVERLSLVPAQARLEMITVPPLQLTGPDAFQIALSHRLDFMNGRTALVDRWRNIQVNADALQSVLNLTANGDIRTARNNAASFRAPTGSVRVGMEFDAPLTRVLERNAYRESLIEYQRSRRQFIQSRDALQLGIRALLRNLEQQRRNLEIQRRAVTIAMRRVDQTQLDLTEPRPPAQPGTRPFINPTTAINLLGAQGALQDTQNAFLSAWLNYYATRMRLYREMGTMALDLDGRWIEAPMVQPGDESLELPTPEELVPPPLDPAAIPAIWIDLVETDGRPRRVPRIERASFQVERLGPADRNVTRLPAVTAGTPTRHE